MINIERPHVAEWLNRHPHQVLELGFSSEFEAYLNTLPWAGSHIDWRLLDHKSLELPEDIDADFIESCRRTPWGRHDYLMIMYSGMEPALLCGTVDAISDIDLLYSGAPGTRFSCGADVNDGRVILNCLEFVEYDGYAEFTYPIRR
ncbi:hypothetical protein [Actinoplanes sp. G11-F43]|uniref:hypothetical protein n=1 Tax=Actinoplanes sp. G11-F43 TaxID=3424130 RepID=UPI003D339D82